MSRCFEASRRRVRGNATSCCGGLCEDLGLTDVATVISSGNIVFETDRTDAGTLEDELE